MRNQPGRYARAGEAVDAVCDRCGEPITCAAWRAVGPAGRWHVKHVPADVRAWAARFREAHPGVSISAHCRRAVWADSDGDAHEVVYANPRHLLERLEAEFARGTPA